jgi:hypothetical protein
MGVGGLGWFLYHIFRYKNTIMQVIEERTHSIYVLFMSVYGIIGIYYVFFGQINYDEGFELYASNLVYAGKIPYIDYMYTHGPLLPYIYGIPQLLFGSNLYVGRLTSLVFGIIMLPFVAKIAERFGGKIAGVITLALISFNPYSVYLFSYAKSYELTVFFLVLSLYFLFCRDNLGNKKYLLSVFFMCLATGVRPVALVMLIALVLYIVYIERKNVKTIVLSAGTGLATLGMLFIPFLILNKDVVIYDMFWLYSDAPYLSAHNKLSNLLTIIDRFLVIQVLFVLGALVVLFSRQQYSNHVKFLYIIVPLTFAAHFVPIETLPEHPVILAPVAATLAGFGFSRIYSNSEDNLTRYLLLLTVIIVILFVLISNGPQWVDLSGNKKPIEEVDEIASYIKDNTSKDAKLLAFSTYAAVQADRELLPGFGLAYYVYRPDWSDEKAREYSGISRNLLNQYIESRNAGAILLTNIEKGIVGSETVGLIEANYDLVKTMGWWGQYSDTVSLYLPKKMAITVQSFRMNYNDTQTWNVKLPPNADYRLTLRSPGNPVFVIGSGSADENGEASGSFVVGGNLPLGATALRVELASNPSIFEERTFIIGNPPGSITLTLQRSIVTHGETQIWIASDLVPYERYVVTVRSPGNPVFVIGSGSADENGEASGSFVVGGNLPLGDNTLRLEIASNSSYHSEATFRID